MKKLWLFALLRCRVRRRWLYLTLNCPHTQRPSKCARHRPVQSRPDLQQWKRENVYLHKLRAHRNNFVWNGITHLLRVLQHLGLSR